MPDDAEARRGDNGHAAVALVAAAGNQRMDRRTEANRGRVGGNVVHASVGNEECTGNAIGGYIGQRRRDGGEQFGAVGFAVRLTGLDHADFKPLDVLQACDQGFTRLLGLPGALAEILAWAFVDHDRDDRRKRFAFLAGEGRIGQCQQDQRQRGDADGCPARPREHQDCGDHNNSRDADP